MSGQETPEGAAVIPAVGSPGSLSAVRSLGRRGVRTIAVSSHDRRPTFASTYCQEAVDAPTPRKNLQGYRDRLLELAARDGVESILPMREQDVYVLARNRSRFAEHVDPLWPNADQLETVHDRRQLYEVARRAGITVPESHPLPNVDSWDREWVVKARYALRAPAYAQTAPRGQCRVPPTTCFPDPGSRPAIEELIERMGHVPLAQEFLPGEEFCFRALCVEGSVVTTSQKRLVRGYKYARGPSICHEAVRSPRLERLGRTLLEALDWHGVASVGFMRDRTGAFTLLELNPRFWANLPMDVRAGVDYPWYFWERAVGNRADWTEGDPQCSGNRCPPSPESVRGEQRRTDGGSPHAGYREGTVTHLLRGELVHLHSVAAEEYPLVERPPLRTVASEVGRSLVRHPNFDMLSLRDPKPFLRDTANAFGSLFDR